MATSSSALVFPPFRLEVATGTLWRGRQQQPLRALAAAVLQYLGERPGQLVSKKELLSALWPETVVSEGVLKTSVWEIRRALGDPLRKPCFIATVPRRGYRFIGKVVSAQSSVVSPQPSTPPCSQLVTDNWQLTTPLVDREAELQQLQERLEKTLTGERQIVFITGEAGIGKTTLVTAFLQRIAATEGLLIAQGHCIEQYGASEAFLPLLEALGGLGRGQGRTLLRRNLRRYAPSWLLQLPALLSPAAWEKAQTTRGVTHERMLREIGEALEALTAERRLVLVLEDLHWSDASTLDLFSFLGRRQEPARLLILGTYRPIEALENGHPLRAITHELSVRGQSVGLPLGALSEAAVGEYLAVQATGGVRDGAPFHALTRAIHQRTEGNPLFLVNLVKDLQISEKLASSSGERDLQDAAVAVQHRIPQSLQQMIERQLDRLSAEEQHLLEVASVVGMEFSAAAVAALLPMNTISVEEGCETLARRYLFLQSSGKPAASDRRLAERYQFRHALYHSVVYGRVTAARRRFLHQQVGEWKEAAYGKRARDIAAELAMHFEHGGDHGRAIYYLHQGGENASRRSAHTWSK